MSLFSETDPSQVTFDALVGEGKKYRDQDAVAKAIIEKDRFIEQLKLEKQEVLRDLQTRQTPPVIDRTQEILDRLEVLRTPATEMPNTMSQERVESKGLTEDDVWNLLQKRELEARAKANIEKTKSLLSEKYGEHSQTVLKSLQEKMGVDQKFLDNLAATSPTAFQTMLQSLDFKPAAAFTPPTSHMNTEGFKPTNSGAKPRSYYLTLKTQDSSRYNSSAVQNAMYKDAMALGEAFYDVNE